MSLALQLNKLDMKNEMSLSRIQTQSTSGLAINTNVLSIMKTVTTVSSSNSILKEI